MVHYKTIKDTYDLIKKMFIYSKAIAYNFKLNVLEKDGKLSHLDINTCLENNNYINFLVADGKLFYLIDTSKDAKNFLL